MPIGGAASGGAPAVHGALHLGDGADPIDWSTVHGRGSLGAIPAASADNEGYLYFSTSDSVLYRSTGSIWESVAQAPDSDLAALAALTGTGLVARTGAGTAATRTLQAGSGITIANGDGVAGDPSVAANPGKVGGLFVWCHSYGQLSGIPGATLGIGGNERAGNFTRRFAAALGVPSSEILLIGKSGAQAASPQIGDTGEQQGVGAVLRWWSPQHLYSGQNQALRWTSRARGAFCAVMLGVNDPARDTSGLSLGITLNAYKHGIRTAVSRLRAAAVAFYNDATIAYTGTWSDVTTTTASRGTVKRTSTLNDFFTITLPPTFRGGVVGLVYHGNVNTGSAPAATTGTTVTYSGTAGVTGTTVLAGQGCAGARIQVTHRVTLTAAAAGKTIIGTLTAKNSGETLDFDSWHIEDDNHAGVMLVNQPLQWFASTAGFFAPHNIVLLAPYGYDFNDGLAAVAAEFPSSVFVADAEAYFDARFKATVSGAITANATPNLAAQTIRIIPTNAALCTIDVGSILRVRAKEEFLVTAKDTTNGGLNDGKWLLTVTRNYTGSNESGTDATNNVATSSGEAIFDCSWLLPDRIHPSDYGHALLAEVMIRAFASISYSETNAAKSGQFALSDHPKPPDGDCYYWPRGGTRTTITAGQQTADEIQATRIRIDEIGVLTQVRCEVTAFGGASRTGKLGVWADGEGEPGNLIAASGEISFAANGIKTFDCWIPVNRGYVWVGLVQQGTGTLPAMRSVTDIRDTRGPQANTTILGGATADINGVLKTGVSGALPDPFGTPTGYRRGSGAADSIPLVELVVSHPFR